MIQCLKGNLIQTEKFYLVSKRKLTFGLVDWKKGPKMIEVLFLFEQRGKWMIFLRIQGYLEVRSTKRRNDWFALHQLSAIL